MPTTRFLLLVISPGNSRFGLNCHSTRSDRKKKMSSPLIVNSANCDYSEGIIPGRKSRNSPIIRAANKSLTADESLIGVKQIAIVRRSLSDTMFLPVHSPGQLPDGLSRLNTFPLPLLTFRYQPPSTPKLLVIGTP